MPDLIELQKTDCLSLAVPDRFKKRNTQGLSTSDFRRILTDLKHRPPSQRAFLRKLLSRAIAAGAPTHFPVASHVVPDPEVPS
jgi:hypothetical protein